MAQTTKVEFNQVGESSRSRGLSFLPNIKELNRKVKKTCGGICQDYSIVGKQ